MTFVVTEQCIRCKFTDCVDVCPVECFHEGPNFIVIDPQACIDCALCVPECPVGAIYDEKELPAEFADFVAINAELAQQWPVIAETGAALADAEEWAEQPDKRRWLQAATETA